MGLPRRTDGQVKHGARGLVGVIVTLMVAVVAPAATLWFQHVNANALGAQKQLAIAAAQLAQQDGLEWRAISGLVPLGELRSQLSEVRARTRDSLAQAEQLGLRPSRT